MRFNFQISKYYSRENDTVQILDRFSFFLRKACKPTSSEATHLFCRQTRIYCLSRKTIADKYIFLTELYIFIFGIALFRTFEESVLKYDFAAPAPLKGDCISNCCISMLKRHDLATKMRWATVQEKWKWTVTKKPALIQELKSESEIRRGIIALAQYWILLKRG